MSTTKSRKSATEWRNDSRRANREILICLGVTVLLYIVFVTVLQTALNGSGFAELVLERGVFQHVNTLVFLFGLLWLATAARRFHEESRCRSDAEQVRGILLVKWRRRGRKLTGDSVVEVRPDPRSQGHDVLQALVEGGYAKLSGHNYQLLNVNLYTERIHRLGSYLDNTRSENLTELMDLNRDLSALDEDRMSSPFGIVRYFLYLMPVIGFLGTVWGIGQAMGSISHSLPSITDIDGFIVSLGGATGSLEVAFDTTLLALLYSGILTFTMTLASRRGTGVLAELDTWIIDHFLNHLVEYNPTERTLKKGFQELEEVLTAGFQRIVDEDGRQVGSLTGIQGALGDLRGALREESEVAISELRGVHEAARSVADGQRETRRDLESLTQSVEGLPDLVAKLQETIGRLQGFAKQLEDVGELSTQVTDGVGSLEAIRETVEQVNEIKGALIKFEHDSDGQMVRRDAITSIEQMSETLSTQVAEVSRQNAREIERAVKSSKDVNGLLKAAMDQLTSSFLELAQEIRELRILREEQQV